MTPQVNHFWTPINDLPSDWKTLEDPHAHALVKAWHDQAEELRSRNSYHLFLDKLKRQWAVETGAIEDIYFISDGATKTLIEKGLDAALLTHEDTDREPPNLVVAKIRDQLQAVDGLYQFVASERPLSKAYLLELHQVVTAHQETHEARDTLGSSVRRPLPRGIWKKLPNNVEGPDGFRFEFCPPEQVESELDRLVQMHRDHAQQGVSPEIEAAWLHHRLSLIHPFTDGNGRIARCLATLVLLRARWLPLVVTRTDKPEYISALRRADAGDLAPLVRLLGNLQRKAIREALTLGEEALQEQGQIHGILESIKARFDQQREKISDLVERSYRTADTLQVMAETRLTSVAEELNPVVTKGGAEYRSFATGDTRNGARAHYNYHQIVACAKTLGYFANLPAYRAWAGLTIVTDVRAELLFSFHGIGHGATGVVGCSAMFYTRRPDDDGNSLIGEVTPLTVEPFDFAYAEDPTNVQRRFRTWMEGCVVAGLTKWRNELG